MPIAATASLVYSMLFATFAYLLPGYQTFKAVERKSSDDVREWACYWTVLATLYCLQPFIDLLASWLPFYYLAKLGFLLGLWYPSTKWAQYLYARGFSPLVSSYEADIDKLYMDGRTKLADLMGQHASTLKSHSLTLLILPEATSLISLLLRHSFTLQLADLLADLMGQHASTLKGQARNLSGQATVLLKNIQQKAMDKAKAGRAPGGDATAGHGLHTE
uniref:HVA22-like protein n=1 Tax=Tetradesmus obliquus TaxID=3088 RepID=A0A383W286_TETOB